MVFRRRGAVGPGPVPWVQQADPPRAEHDSEGRRSLRTSVRPTNQRSMYIGSSSKININ
jgi:hypothetical protein